MDGVGIDEAWVAHLPSLFWRAPGEGTAWLYETTARERRLRPVPALHPGLAGWDQALGQAVDRSAPAVRWGPTYHGREPAGPEVRELLRGHCHGRRPLLMAAALDAAPARAHRH